MFEKFHKKLMMSGMRKIGVDSKPEFEGWGKKVMYYWAFKISPFVVNVTIYILLFWIINGIRESKGFEIAILSCFMIIIFEISSLAGKISEINGEHEENEYDKLKRLEEESKKTESLTNQKTS